MIAVIEEISKKVDMRRLESNTGGGRGKRERNNRGTTEGQQRDNRGTTERLQWSKKDITELTKPYFRYTIACCQRNIMPKSD